jgi:hypothetical protein
MTINQTPAKSLGSTCILRAISLRRKFNLESVVGREVH